MSVLPAEKTPTGGGIPPAFPCFDPSLQNQVIDLGKNLGLKMAPKKKKVNDKPISIGKTRIIFVNQTTQRLIEDDLKEIVYLLDRSKASNLTIAFVRHLPVYSKDMVIDDSFASSLCIRIQYHQMDIDFGYMPTEISVIDLVEKLNSTKQKLEKKMGKQQIEKVDWLAPELRQRLVNFIKEVETMIEKRQSKELERNVFSQKLQNDFKELVNPNWASSQMGKRFTKPILSEEDNENALFVKICCPNRQYRAVMLGQLAKKWLKMEEISNPTRKEVDDDVIDSEVSFKMLADMASQPIEDVDIAIKVMSDLKLKSSVGTTAALHLKQIQELKNLEKDVVDLEKILAETKSRIKEISNTVVHSEDELKKLILLGDQADDTLDLITNAGSGPDED